MSSKENGVATNGPDNKEDNWFTQHTKQIAVAVVVLVVLAAGGGTGAFFYTKGQKGKITGNGKVDFRTSGSICIGKKTKYKKNRRHSLDCTYTVLYL